MPLMGRETGLFEACGQGLNAAGAAVVVSQEGPGGGALARAQQPRQAAREVRVKQPVEGHVAAEHKVKGPVRL